MEDKEKPKVRAGFILKIGLIIFGLFLLMAIYHPWNWWSHRPKYFCQLAESDANEILAAMAEHFSLPEHHSVTREDIEKRVSIDNPWTIMQCGDRYYIHVVDRSGECPKGKKNMDSNSKASALIERAEKYPCGININDPNWNEGVYTKVVF